MSPLELVTSRDRNDAGHDADRGDEYVALVDIPLDELRFEARELADAVTIGDADAVARVLASHPKYGGRGRSRLDVRSFTLWDAQATLARELGHESWRDLVTHHETEAYGEPDERWSERAGAGLMARALRAAAELGEPSAGPAHVLLALVDPPEPTRAARVLAELGIDREWVLERRSAPESDTVDGTRASSALNHIVGFAAGLAAGLGRCDVDDTCALLSLVYQSSRMVGIADLDLDGDEIVEALLARGAEVPLASPPLPPDPHRPLGPAVFVAGEDRGALARALTDHDPSAVGSWGWNVSAWKPGWVWFVGPEDLAIAEIARAVVVDASSVIELPFADAMRQEDLARSAA
ncbi:MAG: hypothetical protein S0880_34535 [Actinomycetota bacterium]|nr:hypothetical protein [Actinomycetota bacterium]